MSWKFRGIVIALAVVIADQVSKWWIVTRTFGDGSVGYVDWLTQKAEQAPYAVKEITSFLNLVMVWNPGVSFGMAQTDSQLVSYGLTAMAVLISVGFMVWLWREPRAILAWAIGLVVGGALGNVLDRLRFGAVADFIDVHMAGQHWPAFNIADSAVTLGVAILLYDMLFLTKSGETQ